MKDDKIIKYYENFSQKDYVNDRVLNKIRMYFRKSKTYLFLYRSLAILTITASALIPILTSTSEVPKIAIIILSFLVIVGVSVESVFNFRETYKNFKNAEDNLRKEYFLFQSRCDPYTRSDKEYFKLLVFRIESIIIKERSDTIEKLTENLNKENR